MSDERAGSAGASGMPELSEAKRALLARKLAARAASRAAGIPRRADPARAPLSGAQEEVWLLEQRSPGLTAYHLANAWRVRGPFDEVAIHRALNTLVERHESLRTTFALGADGPEQRIGAPRAVEMDIADLTAAPDESDANATVQRWARRTFDLTRDLMIRAGIVRLASDDRVLFIMVHHLAVDAPSISVLYDELATVYAAARNGALAALAPAAVQYADYAAWERGDAQQVRLAAELARWRDRLADAPESLDLPTDRPRGAAIAYSGGTRAVTLSRETLAAVRALAQRHEGTTFMVLFAGFAALLARYAGQSDVTVGVPVAGRRRPELARAVGFYTNMVALRADLSGDPTFDELLTHTRARVLDAFDDQEVPFNRIAEALRQKGRPPSAPVFQVMFVQQELVGLISLDGVAMEPMKVTLGATKFDLTLMASERSEGLRLALEYRADLFDGDTAQRMVTHLGRLIERAVATPAAKLSSISLMDDAERTLVLETWNDTARAYPDTTLVALLDEQARRTPSVPAVSFEGRTLTYAQLHAQADALAARLRAAKAGRGALVGVCADRSVELVVALVAVVKAGAAYVPLDPEYPADRLAFMLEDSAPAVVLTTAAHRERLGSFGGTVLLLDAPDGATASFVPPEIAPSDTAYMIYTSGSTGRPKGALNAHRGIVNRLLWMQEQYGLTERDIVLQKTPYSFDVSVWEFFWPLIIGARLVVARPGGHRDPAYLADLIARERVTVCHFVPSMLGAFLASRTSGAGSTVPLDSLRHIMCSGEALMPDHVAGARTEMPAAAINNLYGPTECAVDVSHWTCTEAEAASTARVPIGRPVANTRLYVLDPAGMPLPAGVPGELYIAGVQVGLGYHRRPELTSERFVADPFSNDPSARMYRTGDRARWRGDGVLEYLGRLDTQVKLRGFRIELGEIEATLAKHPAVEQAAVLVRTERGGALVAYVVAAAGHATQGEARMSGTAALRDELQRHLARDLPDYMVPSAFVFLDALPLTSSGKLDRKALPVPPEESAAVYIAPRTPHEQQVADVFATVLDRERVGADDDFFALGGHSLLAMRVIAGIATATGVRLPIVAVWNARTVAALASLVEQQKGGDAAASDRISPRGTTDHAPLSYAQELVWLYEQKTPGTAAYNVPLARRIRGPLDVATLARAFDAVVERHESLRTQFLEVDGTPRQVAVAATPTVIERIDLSAIAEPMRSTEAERLVRTLANETVDLSKPTQPRVVLITLASDDAMLVILTHHIVVDGVSAAIVVRDVAAAYDALTAGGAPDFSPLPIQYADFASWEREGEGAQRLASALAFWRAELEGAPATVELQTDFPRAAPRSHGGARYATALSAETRDALQAVASSHDATLFMALMAGFQTLLHRYTGQPDLVVGTAMSGRDRTETAGLVGYLANALVMRAQFDNDPGFATLLRQVRQRTLRALEHQHVPYEPLVRELRAGAAGGEQSLFNVVLTVQDVTVTVPRLGAASLEPVGIDTVAPKFDMFLSVAEVPAGIEVVVDYRSDLFTAETIERLVRHFEVLLAAAARHPETPVSRLPLMTADERELVVSTWNDTAAPYPAGRAVHTLIAEQAARTPQATAVVSGRDRLSYAELESRAAGLAGRLRQLGVGRGEMVGIVADRSAQSVVGILAILKAGAAYVPLDPAYPRERLAFMARDTGFKVLVGSVPARALLGETTDVVAVSPDESVPAAARLDDDASGSSLAYVIYTSGSTGMPKGVQVTHENLTVSTWARVLRYPEPVGSYLLLSSFAFDSSIAGLFWTLVQGGTLVVPPEGVHLDAVALCALIRSERVTHLLAIPTFYQALLAGATKEDLVTLRVAMTGGDWCSPELIAAHRTLAPQAGFYTEYGPTETTVWCSVMGIEPGAPVPQRITIGPPMPNYRMYILDAVGEARPINVSGEIYIGGLGVSNGYLNRPDLNAHAFVGDPFNPRPGSRMYRTGERGRWLSNGEIEFLGRMDFQVKVRGYRVELKEIEVALSAHPRVAQAAVILRPERGGTIVGYVTLSPPATPGDAGIRDDLRAHLARQLPEYMVPASFVMLDAMPVTSSGKVDRNALPAPEAATSVSYEPPQGPVEEVVAFVWRQALQTERVGRRTSFFELGGHSLLVTRVVAALAKLLRIHVPIRTMFDAPTVADVAAAVIAREPTPGHAVRVSQLVLKLQAKGASAPDGATPAATP